MSDPTSELSLEELTTPPLYRLVDEEGRDVYAETGIGGEPATVGVIFASEELAREFSARAPNYDMDVFAGLAPRSLGDWCAVEVFASAGEYYVLVISVMGSGLFLSAYVSSCSA